VDFSGSYMGVGDASQGTPANWGGQDFSQHTLQWPGDVTARFLLGNVEVFTLNQPDTTQTLATLSNAGGTGRGCALNFFDTGYGEMARIGYDIYKNGFMKLGGHTVGSTPFIDFHSVGAVTNNFDVRMIANGGVANVDGQGQLTIHASMVNLGYLNVTHIGYFGYVRCYTDIQAERGLFEKNVPALSDGAYSDGNLELRTYNSSLPRIGFHRAGHDAIALYYNGGTALRGRTASGWDDKLAWMSDVSAAFVSVLGEIWYSLTPPNYLYKSGTFLSGTEMGRDATTTYSQFIKINKAASAAILTMSITEGDLVPDANLVIEYYVTRIRGGVWSTVGLARTISIHNTVTHVSFASLATLITDLQVGDEYGIAIVPQAGITHRHNGNITLQSVNYI
jgi:hypothetical protein